jgi:hypothetical protein
MQMQLKLDVSTRSREKWELPLAKCCIIRKNPKDQHFQNLPGAPSHALPLELHRLRGAHLYEENMVTTIAKTLADGEIVKYFLAFKTPLHARAANC